MYLATDRYYADQHYMVDRRNLKDYVDDVDAAYGQAVDAGAVPIMPPTDAF